jgi:ABC-type phosphate/phosphonate transport system substrate-binding protein
MNQLTKTLFSFAAAITLVTGMLVASVNSQVSAQVNNSTSNATAAAKATNQKSFRNVINITGTVPLGSTINKALTSEAKTTLTDAILTAQKLVGSNSSATLAVLRPLTMYT